MHMSACGCACASTCLLISADAQQPGAKHEYLDTIVHTGAQRGALQDAKAVLGELVTFVV